MYIYYVVFSLFVYLYDSYLSPKFEVELAHNCNSIDEPD